MTIVQTLGGLTDLQPEWFPRGSGGSLTLYSGLTADYAALYRTQPNVRICVDFLARNVAQLGLHVFRLVSDTDRERLRAKDHPLADLIEHPNPYTTRYERISALMVDHGIYGEAFELKIRDQASGRLALVRIPPYLMQVEGRLAPSKYVLTINGQRKELDPSAVIHYKTDNPENPLRGLSTLETLRRVLAEEEASGDYREHYWQNGARMAGIIKRPKDAPEWGRDTRDRFKAEFEALYSGSEASGRTAILEDGMEWQAGSFSSEQSEGIEHRKLSREICAAAYHIPLPMVGILEHATFSNIREQHKNLYQDCLGPTVGMLVEKQEQGLLSEFADTEGVYLEFNIAEKLSGSFEEQAAVLQQSVGRPWMAPNEARARFNLPAKGGDADDLAVPVNLVIDDPVTGVPDQTDTAQAKIADVQRRTLNRQRQVMQKRLGQGFESVTDAWDTARWDRELSTDLAEVGAHQPLVLAQQINAQHRALLEDEHAN